MAFPARASSRKSHRSRGRASARRQAGVLALGVLVSTGFVLVPTLHPAGADQLGDAKAQAAAIAAQIQATDQHLQSLTDQYSAAEYKLSQLDAQIGQTQQKIAQAKAAVAKDQSQLQRQAISDYTSSGTHNTMSDLFTADRNASGVQQEYSSLAAGNVTTLIARLHTSVAQLSAQQASLQQQQSDATQAKNTLASAKSQASALVAQETATKAGVDANIQALIAQQQAAASAAAAAAFEAKIKASQAAAAPRAAAAPPAATSRGTTAGTSAGPPTTTVITPTAPPPPLPAGAAGAIQAAEGEVGVPYVWGGTTPAGFDCSGLIMWAYAQVGISLPHYSGAQYNSTVHIPFSAIQPGDLLFYGPQGSEHESMYVGGGQMIEAPHTGASVRIVGVRTDSSTVVGRVQ